MTALKGADPAIFQSTNRYRQRGYTDTLPPCPINPEPDGEWVPGFTSLKPKKPFYKKHNGTSYRMDVLRCATFAAGKTMPDDVGVVAERFTEAIDEEFTLATSRGRAGHVVAEQLLLGYEPNPALFAEAADWIESFRRAIAALRIQPTAIEVPVFGDGWAGTADLFAVVDGRPAVVDWKTRGADSAHGAYEEEAAQLGAYSSAGYMIVDDNGTAARRRLPEVEIGVVISVRPDGFEAYPVDISEARAAFEAMLGAHGQTRTFGQLARRAIGKPLEVAEPEPTIVTAEPTEEELHARCERLRARVAHIIEAGHADTLLRDWPTGVSTLKENPQPRPLWRIEAIEALCAQVEKVCEVPYGDEVDGTLEFDHPKIQALIPRLAALPQDLLERVTGPAMHPGTDDDWEAVPNLRTGKVTSHHLATIERFLAPIEVEHEARKGFIESERIALDSEEWWSALVQVVGPEPATWTALQVETLEGLLHAITAEILTIDDDRAVVPTATAADRLVDVVGPKRQINARAKDFAGRLGIDPPRSADDVLATPALCGLVVAEAMGGPAEEAAVSAA